MEAYILRRDLLKPGYDYNTVLAMSKEQLANEQNRQLDFCLLYTGKEDNFIAIYQAMDLEDLINLDDCDFDPQKYYIRIFLD